MHFTYQKLAMEILGFVNMNKTERITYAFNMRAPRGRYYMKCIIKLVHYLQIVCCRGRGQMQPLSFGRSSVLRFSL